MRPNDDVASPALVGSSLTMNGNLRAQAGVETRRAGGVRVLGLHYLIGENVSLDPPRAAFMKVSDIHITRVCLCFQRRLGNGQLLCFAQSIAFDRKLDQELSSDGMMNNGLVTHNSFWVSVVLMA